MDTPPKREPRPDSVFFTDVRGEIVFSNRYAERVVGRRLTDIADDFPMFACGALAEMSVGGVGSGRRARGLRGPSHAARLGRVDASTRPRPDP